MASVVSLAVSLHQQAHDVAFENCAVGVQQRQVHQQSHCWLLVVELQDTVVHAAAHC